MNTSRLSFVAAIALLAVATVAINYQVKVRMQVGTGHGSTTSLGKLKLGDSAPDFTLPDLAGQEVALSAYRGKKVVVLDFWATWCGPCRMAMPGLQALHEEMKGDGVVLVSVNQAEGKERVRGYIERKKYTFLTVLDGNGDVGNLYGVRALPTLIVVDKQGAVRKISIGMHNDSALRKELLALAREP
jgi:peroxiredoxin